MKPSMELSLQVPVVSTESPLKQTTAPTKMDITFAGRHYGVRPTSLKAHAFTLFDAGFSRQEAQLRLGGRLTKGSLSVCLYQWQPIH